MLANDLTPVLDGIVVIDASTMGASPWISARLADFGARVIKVELPGSGDLFRAWGVPHEDEAEPTSLLWKIEARNKECVTLDLRAPEGQELFRRLVARADVLTENYRPGRMEAWGLGPEDLRADHPGLIYVRTTGWGQESPYRDWPAYGTLVEAMSGFAELNGDPDGPPTLPPMMLGDYVSSLLGSIGVLLALMRRAATGRGQTIDNSLFDAIVSVPPVWLAVARNLMDGTVMRRTGNGSEFTSPRGLYQAADGRWLALCGGQDDPTRRILAAMRPEVDIVEDERFRTAADRVAHRDVLERVVGDWVASLPRDEAIRRLRLADAPAAPVNTAEDLANDPHVMARTSSMRDDDFGVVAHYQTMPAVEGARAEPLRLGAPLGADNEGIWCDWLGMDRAELDRLREKGVI